jgi:hypothetical protein
VCSPWSAASSSGVRAPASEFGWIVWLCFGGLDERNDRLTSVAWFEHSDGYQVDGLHVPD